MDTGSLEIEKIARIRQINQKPYLNVLQQIYNGTGYVSVAVNPYDVRVPLDENTNGMQFKPEINEGNLDAYDNSFFRAFSYQYSEDSSISTGSGDKTVKTKVYK